MFAKYGFDAIKVLGWRFGEGVQQEDLDEEVVEARQDPGEEGEEVQQHDAKVETVKGKRGPRYHYSLHDQEIRDLIELNRGLDPLKVRDKIVGRYKKLGLSLEQRRTAMKRLKKEGIL